MKIIMKTLRILVAFYVLTPIYMLQAQEEDEYVIYYRETNKKFEELTEIPHDTLYINDTIYISDIDAFLKQYNCDLKQFVEKYGAMQSMIDSLNTLSGERLYYNYYLPQDTSRNVSNRFIFKTFQVLPDSVDWLKHNLNDPELIEQQSLIRKELLFTIEGVEQVNSFLKNPAMIQKTISALFQEINRLRIHGDTIKGINLYFPDFDFKEKRAMAQFVKSVRIIMDASRDYKYPATRLNITFRTYKGEEGVDRNFQYCLMQDASEVLFLGEESIDNCYVKGYRMTEKDKMEIHLIPQLISHFYIARLYLGSLDIRKANLTEFSEKSIEPYLSIDYKENKWERYLFALIIFIFLIIILIVLYYTYIPVSTFINENMEIMLLISLLFILEMLALMIAMFQNMSKDDSFSLFQNNPILIFSLPLIVVVIIPLLRGISKKRRIP